MAHFSGSFYSESLAKDVPFTAILPTINEGSGQSDNRITNITKAKRTLYILHGWNGTHSSWLVLSRIYELARKHDIAVIMPAGENSFYIDQYEGQLYGQFIGEELVSVTRELFHLSTKREDTWIAGLSMGGYGAIRNGFKYSDTFGKIAAFSSPIITAQYAKKDEKFEQDTINLHLQNILGIEYIKDMDKDVDLYELIKLQKYTQDFYLSCGLEDGLIEENRQYHQFLKNNRIPHEYRESHGGHDWDFWNEQIKKAIEWFTE